MTGTERFVRYHQNGYVYDRLVAQNLLSSISVIIPLIMILLYMATPHASDAGSGNVLVVISTIIIAVTSYRLFRNWKRPRNNAYQLFGAFIDFSAISAILIGYALTYDLPLSSVGKSPTANVFFIYLASRIALFDGGIMVKTALIAMGMWTGLIALSLLEPGFAGRTSGYVEYLTGFKVLIGAEVERIVHFGFISGILYAYISLARHDPLTGFLRRAYFLEGLSKFLSLPENKHPDSHHALVEVRITDMSDHSDYANGQALSLMRTLPLLKRVKIHKIGRLSPHSIGIWFEGWDIERHALSGRIQTLHEGLTKAAVNALGPNAPNFEMGGCWLESEVPSETHLFYTDMAIQHAVSKGRASQFFDEAMRAKVVAEQVIEKAIRTGLEHNRFEVVYQPIIDMSCERPVGLEALLRLRDETGAYISPDKFIPIAERQGWINGIMDVLCDQVAEDARQLKTMFSSRLSDAPYININVSPVQLKDMDHTISALTRARKGGLVINAEITESSVLNTQSVDISIERLSKAGFSLAIDDFGTGYSSIERLMSLKVSTLKVDKTFIDNIDDPESYAFLAAIVNLARTASDMVVLEGVETLQQKLLIMQMGVRICQGYYYSPPLHMQDLQAYLAKNFPFEMPLHNYAKHGA